MIVLRVRLQCHICSDASKGDAFDGCSTIYPRTAIGATSVTQCTHCVKNVHRNGTICEACPKGRATKIRAVDVSYTPLEELAARAKRKVTLSAGATACSVCACENPTCPNGALTKQAPSSPLRD